jgi:hypothetical protein
MAFSGHCHIIATGSTRQLHDNHAASRPGRDMLLQAGNPSSMIE